MLLSSRLDDPIGQTRGIGQLNAVLCVNPLFSPGSQNGIISADRACHIESERLYGKEQFKHSASVRRLSGIHQPPDTLDFTPQLSRFLQPFAGNQLSLWILVRELSVRHAQHPFPVRIRTVAKIDVIAGLSRDQFANFLERFWRDCLTVIVFHAFDCDAVQRCDRSRQALCPHIENIGPIDRDQSSQTVWPQDRLIHVGIVRTVKSPTKCSGCRTRITSSQKLRALRVSLFESIFKN